ncbi:CcmD family protein [Daejeonella lutea]|uniref:CcmD family protein n=1 Tax=Daejeonella lutea TaxID=572036 RepID=A0A1T5EYM9_9SPHI|nr:CcmD family protein [Daejeonella lutea]SKB88949.1 CcmD family protein [Daejeonella lutea]
MKKFLFVICFLCLTAASIFAQGSSEVEMATELRSSGKIYVVVAVLAAIFIGLAFYLFSIDNRLKKIEKQQK